MLHLSHYRAAQPIDKREGIVGTNIAAPCHMAIRSD